MTQQQLDCAVATATGESLRLVRHHGFSLLDRIGPDHSVDEILLVIDCPFCGGAIPIASVPAQTAQPTAECDHCELAFAYQPEDVYVATQPLCMPRYSTLHTN